VRSAESELSAAIDEIREQWGRASAAFTHDCAQVRELAERMSPAWTHDAAMSFASDQALPETLSLGELDVSSHAVSSADVSSASGEVITRDDRWRVPVGLDLRARGSLLVYHDAEGRQDAVALLNNAMLRLLASCPAGKVRFTILDPIALGQSFASLMHLADVEPIIVGDRIWTEARHIEQRLADLTEHMEQVIQKYLRNQFETIHEYNTQAGEVAEPLRFLVMSDFPANLSDAALARLKGIIMSGQRCGVYVLMTTDSKPHASVKSLLSELESVSLTLNATNRAIKPHDPRMREATLCFERPPDGECLTKVLAALGDKIRNSSRVRVPFSAVSPDDGTMWTLSAAQELTVALGRAGARRMQHLSLGRGTAQHALVAGRTGSGKSTLFHVLITNLALWYSPAEIEFYLIDFKKGVEFKAYATHGLPHARVIAVESEREFGLSVLRKLDSELSHRGQLFREAGAQDIAAYRRIRPTERMPRILLAIDEFQEFFIEDDRLAQDAALLLDRLVRQGRAFGMHLVMGSQTLGGAFSIARSTIGQMAVRIALQSSEQDSYLIMSEDNTAPRLLTRPGEAIYNDQSGAVEGNSPFQIVWLREEERDRELQRINALAASRGISNPPPIIFEGNVPAHVEGESHRWMTTSGERKDREPLMWLGDAVSIKDPTAARMRRRSGGNVLIVGNDQESSEVIQLVGMLSLFKQNAAAKFRVIDVPHFSSDRGVVWEAIRDSGISSDSFQIDEVPERILAEASAELAMREADPGTLRPPMFVFINGIHRFRDLRKSDDFDFSSDPNKPEKPSETLARILKEGAPFGVHVVAWCDGVNNLERFVNRQTLREFALRIVFQMSATDSTHVIDSPAAQNLGRGRALLYDDETSTVEKFRPYARPSTDWITTMVRTLRSDS
jgi:energy-coupling factor transporter ATP-binding protein EcfA2